MKRFISNSIFLILPLIFWIIFIIIIDPFNYFNYSKLIPDKIKIENADKVNSLMYRTFQFIHNPNNNIIIGDSRTNLLTIEEIEKVSGKEYSRLTTYAAKLNEIYELFWLANEKTKLKNVIIGINFNMFNEFGYDNRVENVQVMINNPFEYIFNPNVAIVSFSIIKAVLLKKNVSTKPKMSKEKFWDYIIKVRAMQWYSKYKYPTEKYKELYKIDKYAYDNDIELIFIITPHHKDFHDQLKYYGLEKEEQKFKQKLINLHAKVIDYDYENEIIIDDKNFSDPIHYHNNISTIIITEIFSQKFKFGKCISCKN